MHEIKIDELYRTAINTQWEVHSEGGHLSTESDKEKREAQVQPAYNLLRARVT